MISFNNIAPQQKSSAFSIAYKMDTPTLSTSETIITFKVPCKGKTANAEKQKVFLFTGNMHNKFEETYILCQRLDGYFKEAALRSVYSPDKEVFMSYATEANTDSSLDPDNYPYILSLSCTVTDIFTTTLINFYWYFYTIVYFG